MSLLWVSTEISNLDEWHLEGELVVVRFFP